MHVQRASRFRDIFIHFMEHMLNMLLARRVDSEHTDELVDMEAAPTPPASRVPTPRETYTGSSLTEIEEESTRAPTEAAMCVPDLAPGAWA